MNKLETPRAKIAVIVPNACDPDYRVVKQAETLARAGYDVRVFCGVLPPTAAPASEQLGGVQYERRLWTAEHTLKSMALSSIPLFGRAIYAPRPCPESALEAQASPAAEIILKNRHRPVVFFKNVKGSLLARSIRRKFPTKHLRNIRAIFRAILKNLGRIYRYGKKFYNAIRRLRSKVKRYFSPIVRKFSVLLPRRVAYKYLKPFSFRYVLERDIEDWRPDIIHAHDFATLYLAYQLSKRLKVPFIFDSHELETQRSPPLSPLLKCQVHRLERKIFPQAAAITTVGYEISKYLSNAYNITPPHVIYNAPKRRVIPLSGRWAEQNPSGATRTLQNDVSLPEDAVILVYTGNVAVNRGVEETIEAMSYIMRERRAEFSQFGPLHLVLVGRCLPLVRSKLEKMIFEKELLGRVHFCEPVSASEVSSYISSATVAVIPVIPAALSYEYAMPNKLFEAMFARLPILGSRLVEMARIIEEHNLGEVFSPGDSKDFADGLYKVLSNQNAYLGLKREEAIDKFCWEAQEKTLLTVFDKVLASG